MAIKKTWIVCDMDGNTLCDDKGDSQEFKSESAALKRAKEWVNTSSDSEAWVYSLSHIASRTDEVTIKSVKH